MWTYAVNVSKMLGASKKSINVGRFVKAKLKKDTRKIVLATHTVRACLTSW